MGKGRLEAFSDGVLAIVITIMVLDLKPPPDARPESLAGLAPVLLSYALSFLFVGIYWNNHHHLLQAARAVDGRVLWANLHLLFWLSFTPVTTKWMGDTSFGTWPAAAYGFVLLCAAVAFSILVRTLLDVHGPDSLLAQAIGADVKGKTSLAMYVAGIAAAFLSPMLACGFYVAVAIIWLFPDRRIERLLIEQPPNNGER